MNRFARGDDRERGATLVEFALIAPILFLILFAMFDIGFAVIGRSIASNAAREGARVGIITYDQADVVGSPAFNAIEQAANEKLTGPITPDPDPLTGEYVAVKCLHGVTKAQIACTAAGVQVDRDVLEVTVRWKSNSPNRIFTANAYRNTARMVITGGIGGASAAPCTTSGGAITWSTPTASVTEGAAGEQKVVTLTAARSGSTTCTTTVGFSTADGSATVADNDYIAATSLITFFPGDSQASVTITVNGDANVESTESFFVNMTAGTAVNGTISNPPPSATVTITTDEVANNAPTKTAMTMWDNTGTPNGKIDKLILTFNEPLQQVTTCDAAASAITLSGLPGASVSNVSVAANSTIATVTLAEGTGFDTSNANLRVSLGTGSCIKDAGGLSAATFTNDQPTDQANPVLLSVSDTNGATDGKFEKDDTVTFNFSEPLKVAGIPTSVDVDLTSPNSGNDRISATNLFNGALNLGSTNYLTSNNDTVNFDVSTVSRLNSNTSLELKLTECTANGNKCNNRSNGTGSITFNFDTDITDPNNLQIVAPTAFNLSLF